MIVKFYILLFFIDLLWIIVELFMGFYILGYST